MDATAWKNRRGEEAVALHPFQAELQTQLDLKRGERLEILEQRSDGWYVGRREGRVGLVPSTRLALIKDKEYARAVFDYESPDPNHLPFVKGNRITVWRKESQGWSVGEREGRIGMFPGTFVEWLGKLADDELSDSTQSSRSGGGSADDLSARSGGSAERLRGDEPYESEDDGSRKSSEGLLSSQYSSEQDDDSADAVANRFARYRPAVPIPTDKDKDDIKVLLQMLDSDDDVQARAALEGIASFLAKDKSGLMAKRHGAIPGLVKRASNLMHAGRPLVVKRELDRVLDFLNFLVEDDMRAASDVHEVGATPQLIGFLATKAHDTTKEKARHLLVQISKDNPLCQWDIVRAGGIPVLCKLLRARNYDLRKDACVVMSRILYGVGSIAQRAMAASPSAIPAMVTVLNTPRADVLEIAAANVTHLVRDNVGNQNRFRDAHGLLSIANLVGHENPRVQLQAAGALMELARDNKANAKAIAGGTTGAVHLVAAVRAQVMKEEPDEQMLNNVLGAIWMLVSQSKSNCAMFLEHGLLFALMPLVEREYRLAHVIAYRLQKHEPKTVVEQYWHYREEVQRGTYALSMAPQSTAAAAAAAAAAAGYDVYDDETAIDEDASFSVATATAYGDDESSVPMKGRAANGLTGRPAAYPSASSLPYFAVGAPPPMLPPGGVPYAYTGYGYGGPVVPMMMGGPPPGAYPSAAESARGVTFKSGKLTPVAAPPNTHNLVYKGQPPGPSMKKKK